MGIVVGVDIGGTFTDCAILDGRSITLGKAPTTPGRFADGFFAAIEDAARRRGKTLEEVLEACDGLVHGTTVGTNAIVSERGAKVGLLVTRGHGDVLTIMNGYGRTAGLTLEELASIPDTDKPHPIVARALTIEVNERITAAGEVVVPLDEGGVVDATQRLLDKGIEALGISFLWSFENPVHEARARKIVSARWPDLFVSCSSDLAPIQGEYVRTATVGMNCYVGPLMQRYVQSLSQRAAELGLRTPLRFALANGGTGSAAAVATSPVHTIHSGPAVGVVASAVLADRMGYREIVTADMGGTTFDVGLVDQSAPVTRNTSFLRQHEIYVPMVDIESVGAGGGSIAWVEPASNGLRVGPRSAGADPGPACYGAGNVEATVTDADLVLGIINSDNFLGGRLRLDVDAAHEAIEVIARQVGLPIDETAAGISRVVDARMAGQVRRMVVNRGLDPRDLPLFAFGGGGATHASAFAREVGIGRVIVPLTDLASVWSAVGAASGDIVYNIDRSVHFEQPFPADALQAVLDDLQARGAELLDRDGVPDRARHFERSVFLKFRTQVFETEVPLGPMLEDVSSVVDRYYERYDEIYGVGTGYRAAGVEITAVRLRAIGRLPKPALPRFPRRRGQAAPAPSGSRSVYWFELEDRIDTPVYEGGALEPGASFHGPGIVDLPETTVVVRPGDELTIDEYKNLILDLGETSRIA